VGCFALCVIPGTPGGGTRVGTERTSPCAASVERARLVGELGPPPREGAGLHLTMAAIHHPRTAAGIVLVLVVLGAVLAVAARRRPRVR